jgi:hypothetical protein
MAKFKERMGGFIDSLNRYIEMNDSEMDYKNITKHIPTEKDRANKPLRLYRGIFFNDLSSAEITKIFSEKTFNVKGISYTKSLQEAMAFAVGENIFSYRPGYIPKLKKDQLGLLVEYVAHPSEIIIDLEYASNNYDILAIENEEVILTDKVRPCKIVKYISDVGIKSVK